MSPNATIKPCTGRFEYRRTERWTGGKTVAVLACTECAAYKRRPGDQTTPIEEPHGMQRAAGLWQTEWVYVGKEVQS